MGQCSRDYLGTRRLGASWPSDARPAVVAKGIIKIAAFAALYFPTFAIIIRFRKPKASA